MRKTKSSYVVKTLVIVEVIVQIQRMTTLILKLASRIKHSSQNKPSVVTLV